MRVPPLAGAVTLVCAAIVFILHGVSFGPYVADDAGISLAYARNLVEGNGLVLTPGGERVEGYSNPLWVLILAAAVAVGGTGQPEWVFKGLGLAFGLGAVALSAVVACRTYESTSWTTGWIAPALLAVSTSFVFWSIAGLENALYAFLILLAVLLYLGESRHPRRSSVWSALALVAVALTRPEGVALFVAFLIHRVVMRGTATELGDSHPIGGQPPAWGTATRSGERPRNSWLSPNRVAVPLWTAAFVVPYGAFLLWRYWYFGAWLPNTFYAKVSDRSLWRLAEYLTDRHDPGWQYLTEFAFGPGLVLLATAAVGLLDRRYWRPHLLFAGIIGGIALYIVYVGGDWWPAHRFLTPVIPLIAIVAQHGVTTILRALPDGRGTVAIPALAVACAAALNAQSTGAIWTKDDDALVGLRSRLMQATRIKALAAAAHIDTPTYLEPDIGGPSLAAGLRIVDLGMLADVHLARFHYYPAYFRQYIFEERRPDFIRTHSVWTRASRVTRYPELQRDYLTIGSWRDGLGLHGEFVRKDRFVSLDAEPRPAIERWTDISLVEFTPASTQLTPGAPFTFTWRWRCEPRCSADYTFHVRIARVDTIVVHTANVGGQRRTPALDVGRQATVARSFAPVFGWYPTTLWKSGEVVATTQSLFMRGMPSGEYEFAVAATAAEGAPAYTRVGTLRIGSSEVVASSAPQLETHDPIGTGGKNPQPAPNVDALLQQAEREFSARRYDAALTLFRDALMLDPTRAHVRRRLEDARERTRWIEYLYDTDRFDDLMALHRTGTLAGMPGERELLEDLEIFRRTEPMTVLHEDGNPVLLALHFRTIARDADPASRIRLYVKVLRAPRRNYQLWLHAYPRDEASKAANPGRVMLTAGVDPRRPTSTWRAGESHAITFAIDATPGEYDLRAGFWRPRGDGTICPSGGDCYLPLGTLRLGQ